MPRLLVLFSLCNLVIGTGAFMITGILELTARGLGVSVPAAGQAITVYALATALLAPLLLLATGRWPRRHVLMLGLTLFTLGNAACALADTLPLLLAGRVLMGAGSLFTAVAAGIAVSLVAPARRGQALAFVFLGISLSYVVGLPLGAWLGFERGWQAPLWAATAASALALLAVAVWVPRDLPAAGAQWAGLGTLLRRADVLLTLGLTLCYFTAIFTVFAYIGPVLQALSPMSSGQLSLTLMFFGLSGVAGTLIGGAANDRFGPLRTLRVQLLLLALTMLVLPLARGHWGWLVVVLVAWGTAGFGMMAPQQLRLASMAPSRAPLLMSLNTSMLYLGTALGAAVGGAAGVLVGLDRLPWVGLVFAVIGLGVLQAGARLSQQPGLPAGA